MSGSLLLFIFTELMSYFGHIMRRQDFLEKITILRKVEGSRKRGRRKMRWTDSLKEATGLSLQELSKAVEDSTFIFIIGWK